MSLQSFDAVILRQDLHLADGDGIELCQTLGLRHSFADKYCIQVFQIGQADQLRDIGVVADVSFEIRMAVPPLFCSHTEEGHVQDIGFTGIHYDSTVYPPLEAVPRRFAITHRNRWMVDVADVVVAYVLHDWGGAATTLRYANQKAKRSIRYPA